jgi:hypothetical protein
MFLFWTLTPAPVGEVLSFSNWISCISYEPARLAQFMRCNTPMYVVILVG